MSICTDVLAECTANSAHVYPQAQARNVCLQACRRRQLQRLRNVSVQTFRAFRLSFLVFQGTGLSVRGRAGAHALGMWWTLADRLLSKCLLSEHHSSSEIFIGTSIIASRACCAGGHTGAPPNNIYFEALAFRAKYLAVSCYTAGFSCRR